MAAPSRLFLPLCCLVLFLPLFGGCATKPLVKTPVSRFPEQPAPALAQTPEQGLSGRADHRLAAVRGGWGYQRDDAFILTVPPARRRKGYSSIPAESLAVHTRNEVEFSGTPPRGQRFAVVDYGTVSRTLSTHQGRMYAVWRGQVRLLSEAQSPDLYLEAANRPLNRRARPEALAQARTVPREYWFDVSDLW